jgi:glutamate N-acetyltransferase/amino-acid N-acetyltransferase
MSLTRPHPRLLARTNRIFSSQVRYYAAPGEGTVPTAKKKYVPTSGTYPLGFKAGSAYVGVKASNTRFDDLALIASDTPCAGAAVFTTNKFQAAPVTVSRDMLKKRKGEGVRAVIINSGCANAVTGRGGIEDAISMGKETDNCFTEAQDDGHGSRSVVMSTGVIGQRLPISKRFPPHMPTSGTHMTTGSPPPAQSAPPTRSPNSSRRHSPFLAAPLNTASQA